MYNYCAIINLYTLQENKMEPWNIKQLYAAWQNDLAQCTSPLEVTMVNALNRKEIIELATKLRREIKLTPGELSILANI